MEVATINPSAAKPQSLANSAFTKLFGIGVIGWLVAFVVVLAGAWLMVYPESIPSAFIWTMSHWWTAFGGGLLLLVAYGFFAKLPVRRALVAYSLPVLVLLALVSICLVVYPDGGFRTDLSTYLPLVILFHVLGLLWVMVGKGGGEQSLLVRAVLPALVGGLTLLGFIAVPVFTGDAFCYRDAFKFTIDKAAVVDGEIRSEATIEIRKPGNYGFVAPRYSFAEYMSAGDGDSGLEVGTITWGSAGTPAAGMTGKFPLRIVWQKGVLPPAMTELPEGEDEVFIDVCDVDESSRKIYFLAAPMKN